MIRRHALALVGSCLVTFGASAAEPAHHVVTMQRVSFSPEVITVHVGDTVEWRNDDIVAHTATSKEAGFDVNVLPGKSGQVVLKRAGEFAYSCRYHPNMRGRVVVKAE